MNEIVINGNVYVLAVDQEDIDFYCDRDCSFFDNCMTLKSLYQSKACFASCLYKIIHHKDRYDVHFKIKKNEDEAGV